MTDALREALERCPFCGSTDVVVHDNGRGLIFNVHCNNCHATGPWERCAADAPHSWNKREALSAPVVVGEREDLRELQDILISAERESDAGRPVLAAVQIKRALACLAKRNADAATSS